MNFTPLARGVDSAMSELPETAADTTDACEVQPVLAQTTPVSQDDPVLEVVGDDAPVASRENAQITESAEIPADDDAKEMPDLALKAFSKNEEEGDTWNNRKNQGGGNNWKSQPSGPDLPRTRVTQHKIDGKVHEWKGKYGWIQPSQAVKHAKAGQRQGRIFVSKTDLENLWELSPGVPCRFHVYEDCSGLGAEEVTVMPNKGAMPSGCGGRNGSGWSQSGGKGVGRGGGAARGCGGRGGRGRGHGQNDGAFSLPGYERIQPPVAEALGGRRDQGHRPVNGLGARRKDDGGKGSLATNGQSIGGSSPFRQGLGGGVTGMTMPAEMAAMFAGVRAPPPAGLGVAADGTVGGFGLSGVPYLGLPNYGGCLAGASLGSCSGLTGPCTGLPGSYTAFPQGTSPATVAAYSQRSGADNVLGALGAPASASGGMCRPQGWNYTRPLPAPVSSSGGFVGSA